MQSPFTPWERSSEASGLVEHAWLNGITFVLHSPVGCAGRVDRLRADPALRTIAAEHGATPEELVLAWMLGRSPTLVAIPGASRTATVESSVRAASLALDPAAAGALITALARLGAGEHPLRAGAAG